MESLTSLDKLSNIISRLPGIGGRTAMRLALYLFDSDEEYLEEFSNTLKTLHSNIKLCKYCFSLSEGSDVCSICSNDRRNKNIICIVESYPDIIAIEKTNEFDGVYHVLGGLIEPIKGIGINDIRIKDIFPRINDNIEEIMIAFSASIEADTTASFIYKSLKNNGYTGKVTRITYGISLASDIENADSRSLARSILDRVNIN